MKPVKARPSVAGKRRIDDLAARLEELEGQIAAIVESSDDIIITRDLDGSILTWNPAAELVFGYGAKEVIGHTNALFIPEDRRAEEAAIFDRVRKGERIQHYETIRLKKDGTPLAVSLTISPVRVTVGKIVGASRIMRNLSDRQQLEQALKECHMRYRLLFENMAEGLVYCRMIFEDGQPRDWIYLEANQAVERLTGIKRIPGRKVSELIPGFLETNPEWLQRFGRVATTGKPERFETYSPRLKIWFSVSAYCPKKEHFVSVFENITERKKVEMALRKSERDLAEAQRVARIGSWSLDARTQGRRI